MNKRKTNNMKKHMEIKEAKEAPKSSCEQCAYFSKAHDEYPCSHCRHCHPDRFKPKEE